MFIPRHTVVENQFCKYGSTNTTTGIGGVVAYAGSVVYLDPTKDDSEVLKMAHGVTEQPFGFLMQKVKTGYHSVHPVGFVMPGDLGSSDAIVQPTYTSAGVINGTTTVPVGVAHLGIYDTIHYTCLQTTSANLVDTADRPLNGQLFYAAADNAKITNSTVSSDGTDTRGERCSSIAVAKVVKGVSAAKATSTITNATQFPIRIKLLV
jgi:hypothetical protein